MSPRSLIAILLVVCSFSLFAQSTTDPSGHWEGVVHAPAMDVVVAFDLAKNGEGKLSGTFDNAAENIHGLPLANVAADGIAMTFAIAGNGGGVCHAKIDGQSMKGMFTMGAGAKSVDLPIELTRTGDAKIAAAPKSPAITKELEGKWSGTIDTGTAKKNVGLRLVNQSNASTGVIITSEGMELPISLIAQKESNVTLEVKSVGGSYAGTLNGSEMTGTWKQGNFSAPLKFVRSTPVDRWANALGGREKLAAIKTTYREATIELGAMKGTIKAWHSSDGRYRKEEQVGAFSTVETFDGTNGTLKQGDLPPHAMSGAELERARSTAYANWNAVFFALFPERRRGTLTLDGDDTVVMKPEGGIDWHVTLDPSTSLPKTMTHQQNDRTIKVDFVAYEPVDGIPFETEIHRSTGDPRFDAVIRFTKTVINPPLDASFFSIAAK